MSYTPTTWLSDTPLSISNLNNMETQYDEFLTLFLAHDHEASYYTRAQMEARYWYAGNDGHLSGSDADVIYYEGGNLHASGFSGMGAPEGLIVLWYGSVNNIPEGWALCNGSNGTRDLRNRFVVGAGNDYAVGESGGSAIFSATGDIITDGHSLTIAEIPSHSHSYEDEYGKGNIADGTAVSSRAGATTTTSRTTEETGEGDPHDHGSKEITADAKTSLPPYYALCYIQKLAEA